MSHRAIGGLLQQLKHQYREENKEEDEKEETESSSSYPQHPKAMGNLLKMIQSEKDKFYEEPENQNNDVTIFTAYYKGNRALDDDGQKIVKKPKVVESFWCDLCNINCTSPVVLETHLRGKKHMRALKRMDRESEPITIVEHKSIPGILELADIQKDFEVLAETDPVIGIQYITEYQRHNEQMPHRYFCELCLLKCNEMDILRHVIGIKHRLRYMRTHSSNVYYQVTSYPKYDNIMNITDAKELLKKHCKYIMRSNKGDVGVCKVKMFAGEDEMKIDMTEYLENHQIHPSQHKDLLKTEMILRNREIEERELEMLEGESVSTSSTPASDGNQSSIARQGQRRAPGQLQKLHPRRRGFASRENPNLMSDEGIMSEHNFEGLDNTLSGEDSQLLRKVLLQERRRNAIMKKNRDIAERELAAVGHPRMIAPEQSCDSLFGVDEHPTLGPMKRNFLHKLDQQEARIENALKKLEENSRGLPMTPEEIVAMEKLERVLLNVQAERQRLIGDIERGTNEILTGSLVIKPQRPVNRRGIFKQDQMLNMQSLRNEQALANYLVKQRQQRRKALLMDANLRRANLTQKNYVKKQNRFQNQSNVKYDEEKQTTSYDERTETEEEQQSTDSGSSDLEQRRQRIEQKILQALDQGSLAPLAKAFKSNPELQAILKEWETKQSNKEESSPPINLDQIASSNVKVTLKREVSNSNRESMNQRMGNMEAGPSGSKRPRLPFQQQYDDMEQTSNYRSQQESGFNSKRRFQMGSGPQRFRGPRPPRMQRGVYGGRSRPLLRRPGLLGARPVRHQGQGYF